jgi:hypothetical protein
MACYDKLQADLLADFFESGGRSRVLFLRPEDGMVGRMTRLRLQSALDLFGPLNVRSAYLAHCWIPSGTFDAWRAVHHLPLSAPRFQAIPVVTDARAVVERLRLKGAKERGVADAIAALWPDDIPAGLAAKERNKAVAKWLRKNGCSVPTDVGRSVQRVRRKMKATGSNQA